VLHPDEIQSADAVSSKLFSANGDGWPSAA
jgi:hypothetical protein